MRHDGTQDKLKKYHEMSNPPKFTLPKVNFDCSTRTVALMPYTVRLAWFLPDAGPVWVRDFGRDEFELDINFSEAS